MQNLNDWEGVFYRFCLCCETTSFVTLIQFYLGTSQMTSLV